MTANRRSARPPAAAVAALFPESANARSARAGYGLLRAPGRGREPPPCLSAFLRAPPRQSDLAMRIDPERLLAGREWETPELLSRAAAVRRDLVAARLGGAWWHVARLELPAGRRYAVVLLDDRGLPDTGAVTDDTVSAATLTAALAENPPDRLAVVTGGVRGARLPAGVAAAAACGAVIIDGMIDPWSLLDHAERVYTPGGEIGFLALLAGVPVSSVGPAFYTGWGVTEDAAGMPQRPFRRSVEQIFAAACLVAMRCRDPFHNAPSGFEEALALLRDWRRVEKANRGIAVCVGMSFWKRRRIADFVRSSAGVPRFRRTVAGAIAAARRTGGATPGAIAGWASRLPAGLADAASGNGVPLIRVEDGFIRSVGLGSDFLPPASLVLDGRGMYFDPRGDSDLEHLLRETDFAPALLARAQRLAAQLVARGVTKYNLTGNRLLPEFPPGRLRILVPGQVEDDLSIVYGAGEVHSNLALLQAVRAANPDAAIVYKPHPDVLAGHRKGAVSEREACRFADAVVAGGSTAALLAVTDELHTMTSLAGFEALLRGRRVVVYGRPFYAGWGLTADMLPRDRGRRLTLDELVAGALILYPRYLDPLTRLPCGPEIVVERLEHPELWRAGPLVAARRLQGALARRLRELARLLAAAGGAARGFGDQPRR